MNRRAGSENPCRLRIGRASHRIVAGIGRGPITIRTERIRQSGGNVMIDARTKDERMRDRSVRIAAVVVRE